MSAISRRTVVFGTAASAVAAAAVLPATTAFAGTTRAPAGVAAGRAAAPEPVLAQTLPVRSDYAGAIGGTFTASGSASGAAWHMTLRAVEDATGAPAGDEHRFRLVFEVEGPGLNDATYTVASPSAPTHLLFLAVGGAAGRATATINRIG